MPHGLLPCSWQQRPDYVCLVGMQANKDIWRDDNCSELLSHPPSDHGKDSICSVLLKHHCSVRFDFF